MENTGTLGRSSCILALLLLTVMSTGSTPVGAQASDHCDRELMACLNKHVTRFDHTKMDTAKSCMILQDFSGCVSNITCLKEEARDELVTNMTVSFKKLGFNCDPDIKVSVEPLPSSVPHDTGMANPCDEAKNNCTKTLVEESFQSGASIGTDMKDWFCPGLNRYLDCLMKAPCDMDNYGQTVRQEIELTMQKAGITCDINTLGDWDEDEDEDGDEDMDADMTEEEKDDMEGDNIDSSEEGEDVKYETHVYGAEEQGGQTEEEVGGKSKEEDEEEQGGKTEEVGSESEEEDEEEQEGDESEEEDEEEQEGGESEEKDEEEQEGGESEEEDEEEQEGGQTEEVGGKSEEEKDEEAPEEEEEGEQAEATVQDNKDSAHALMSSTSGLAVILSLVASLVFLGHH